MAKNIIELWEDAATIDPTLKVRRQQVADLRRKQIHTERYSRTRLFSRMTKGQLSLFTDFPVYVKGDPGPDLRETLSDLISTGFPPSQRARVQTGPSRMRHKLKVPEVIKRWKGGRAILGVTDLHFRGTKFAEGINFSALSDFDILCSDPEFIHFIEMMTLVISSRGNFTDSHADDCDGSNHCFVGKKLWLAWDRIEGKAKGFQDADRDYITGQAVFDMKTFLSLSSSCWFVVEPNETLFLSGSLAHKVITLESYIGVGGFHVTLPSYLRSLRRWVLYDMLDVNQNDLVNKINRAVIEKIYEVQRGPRSLKEDWGLSYMQKAIQDWHKNERPETKKILMKTPTFAAFIEAARNCINARTPGKLRRDNAPADRV